MHCATARLKVRSAVARCGTRAGGSTVRSAVAVDSEMLDRSCPGYVAATILVGGRFLAVSAADRSFLMLVSCLVLLDVPSLDVGVELNSGWKRGHFYTDFTRSTCRAIG